METKKNKLIFVWLPVFVNQNLLLILGIHLFQTTTIFGNVRFGWKNRTIINCRTHWKTRLRFETIIWNNNQKTSLLFSHNPFKKLPKSQIWAPWCLPFIRLSHSALRSAIGHLPEGTARAVTIFVFRCEGEILESIILDTNDMTYHEM